MLQESLLGERGEACRSGHQKRGGGAGPAFEFTGIKTSGYGSCDGMVGSGRIGNWNVEIELREILKLLPTSTKILRRWGLRCYNFGYVCI